jgi:hypothetical protein
MYTHRRWPFEWPQIHHIILICSLQASVLQPTSLMSVLICNVSHFLSSHRVPNDCLPNAIQSFFVIFTITSQPSDYTTRELRMVVSTGGYSGIDYSGFGCQREDTYIWALFCLWYKDILMLAQVRHLSYSHRIFWQVIIPGCDTVIMLNG